MEFGPAILRGVRLGAIVIAVGLVGLTAYRVLDVDDDDDVNASGAKPSASAAPAKPVKVSGQEKFYPPPPPPLPGRAAAAKPVRTTGRDVIVVDVPAAREAMVADATAAPFVAPPDFAVQGSALPEPMLDAPVAAPPPPRSNRFIRSVRKLLHISK